MSFNIYIRAWIWSNFVLNPIKPKATKRSCFEPFEKVQKGGTFFPPFLASFFCLSTLKLFYRKSEYETEDLLVSSSRRQCCFCLLLVQRAETEADSNPIQLSPNRFGGAGTKDAFRDVSGRRRTLLQTTLRSSPGRNSIFFSNLSRQV